MTYALFGIDDRYYGMLIHNACMFDNVNCTIHGCVEPIKMLLRNFPNNPVLNMGVRKEIETQLLVFTWAKEYEDLVKAATELHAIFERHGATEIAGVMKDVCEKYSNLPRGHEADRRWAKKLLESVPRISGTPAEKRSKLLTQALDLLLNEGYTLTYDAMYTILHEDDSDA